MASGFGPVRHGKRTARFDIRLGGRETQLFLEHQLENPATGAADKYVWWVRAFDGTKRSPAERLLLIRAWGARAFVTRAPLAADGVGAVAPVASGSASSLVAPSPLWMLRPDGDVGAAVPLAPELRFGAAGLRAAQDFTSA